jgi:hypothetical protein
MGRRKHSSSTRAGVDADIKDFSGANGLGTELDELLDFRAGNSQFEEFNPQAGVTDEIFKFTGADLTGLETSLSSISTITARQKPVIQRQFLMRPVLKSLKASLIQVAAISAVRADTLATVVEVMEALAWALELHRMRAPAKISVSLEPVIWPLRAKNMTTYRQRSHMFFPTVKVITPRRAERAGSAQEALHNLGNISSSHGTSGVSADADLNRLVQALAAFHPHVGAADGGGGHLDHAASAAQPSMAYPFHA